jgi:hypothetical protein
MKVMKIIYFLSVFIIAILPAQFAMALYTSSMDDWVGSKTYNQDDFDLVLEWAVYPMAENPWAGIVTFPSDDQYIYAYLLINGDPSKDISLFSVLDIGGNPIAQTSMHETQAMGIAEGIMPNPNPSDSQGEWIWAPGGYVSKGTYSAYLIFSSPFAPIKGSFKVVAPEDMPPVPSPEPGTIALLGVASGWFIANRRKKQHIV